MKGADLSDRYLAMIEARSGRPGPLVWLTAGIHGDEVGGIVVVQEIFRRLRRQRLRAGRISAFPLLNPFGFDTANRQIPSTEEDLNRAFPGDARGTFAERIAALVFKRISADAPALVLDLHNDWIRSIPYALIDPRPATEQGRAAHRRVKEIAAITDFVIVDEQEEGVSRAMLRSTLSGSLLESGIPALTLELGAAHVVDEPNVAAGVEAVWNLLVHLAMVDPAEATEHLDLGPAEFRGRVLRYSHRPFPSRAGIVRFSVAPGDTVKEGSAIATLYDVFGRKLEVLRAGGDAVVLGHADSSLAVPGVPLVAMAMGRSLSTATNPARP